MAHDLFFDVFNNLARIYNMGSDIKKSLEYLLIAVEHTKYYQTLDASKISDIYLAANLSELYLNICNA